MSTSDSLVPTAPSLRLDEASRAGGSPEQTSTAPADSPRPVSAPRRYRRRRLTAELTRRASSACSLVPARCRLRWRATCQRKCQASPPRRACRCFSSHMDSPTQPTLSRHGRLQCTLDLHAVCCCTTLGPPGRQGGPAMPGWDAAVCQPPNRVHLAFCRAGGGRRLRSAQEAAGAHPFLRACGAWAGGEGFISCCREGVQGHGQRAFECVPPPAHPVVHLHWTTPLRICHPQVEREFRVLAALQATPVPVPRVVRASACPPHGRGTGTCCPAASVHLAAAIRRCCHAAVPCCALCAAAGGAVRGCLGAGNAFLRDGGAPGQ